jgi:hypothetical protein
MNRIGNPGELNLLTALQNVKAPPAFPKRGVLGWDFDNTIGQNSHSCMALHPEVECVNDETEIVPSLGIGLPRTILGKSHEALACDDLNSQETAPYLQNPETIVRKTDTGLNVLCVFPNLRSPNGENYIGQQDLFIPNAVLLVCTLWILQKYGYMSINASQRLVIPGVARMEFMLAVLNSIFGKNRFFLQEGDTRLLRQMLYNKIDEYFEMSNKEINPDKTFFLEKWNEISFFGKLSPQSLYLVDDCRAYAAMTELKNMGFIQAKNSVAEPYVEVLRNILKPEQVGEGLAHFFAVNPGLACFHQKFKELLTPSFLTPPPRTRRFGLF